MSDMNLEMQNENVDNNQAAATAELEVPNANGAEAVEEYEIEVANAAQTAEGKQDSVTNRAFAMARIERKRQKQLEEEIERLKRGELSEDMRVNPELPPMPKPEDFLSETAIEKYGYDQNVALAAFQQANSEWQLKAMDAKSVAAAKQTQKVSQFINQAGEYGEKVRKHYDVAEKLNIPDFQELEEKVATSLPQGWATDIINRFPDKSAAIFAHLGKNQDKLARLASMDPSSALIEVAYLARDLTIKPKAKVSKAPEPDEILNAAGGANSDIIKKMDEAARKGNVNLYRQLKAQLQGK